MTLRAVIALSVLALFGCADTDPYRRPGMWQPEGANAANLAAMVERPSDLVRGRGERSPETRSAADAVQRLWEDRQRPFPSHAATSATTAGAGAKEGR